MLTKTTLPTVFGNLGARARYVQRVTATEYSSECPRCGDAGHQGSDPPDRCRWFDEPGRERLWCRACGLFMWASRLNGHAPQTPDEIAWRQAERVQKQQQRQQETAHRLERLRADKTWERYHDKLPAHGRAYWRGRGVPDSLQNYWGLGWCAAYPLWCHQREQRVATATIPLFDQSWEALNIKHRIIQPPEGVGKYRYEIQGQQAFFRSDPDWSLTGHIIAVEGEIKAMIVSQRLDKRVGNVIGLPGTRIASHLIEALAQANLITLVMDPGSERQALGLARQIGLKRTRILIPLCKIDDAITEQGLSNRDVTRLIGTSTPAVHLQ